MKKITKSSRKISQSLNNLVLVGAVWAQQQIDIRPKGEFAGLEQFTIPKVVETILKVILVVAAIVSFIYLVIGGIKWITSGGDKEGTQKAQGTITAALIGLVIVFAAWALIRLLESFFGIKIFTLTIPSIPTTAY